VAAFLFEKCYSNANVVTAVRIKKIAGKGLDINYSIIFRHVLKHKEVNFKTALGANNLIIFHRKINFIPPYLCTPMLIINHFKGK
jgi:hypothetical protein